MYKVTYVHKNETEEHDLYIPADRDYCLVTAKLSVGMGISGEFTISIPDENPARHEIVCLTDEIIVYRDEREIWRGRPVTLQIDFDLNGKLTCEGILSYLYDTYYPPFEFEGSPNDLLKDVIENHNSMVEERKQFQIGEITVVDPNDYINRSSIYYNRTITILQEKFIQDSLGGYFRVRVEDGVRYLDYLEAYNTESSQPVRYGYNLLDIAQDIEYSDVASVILPLGTRLTDEDGMETDERLTVASVNNGDIYIKDDQAVETYGWIAVEAEWDDVTLPENLYTKGKDYLKQVTSPISRFTVRAIDLSLADPEIDPINLGDFVLIRVDAFGMNEMVELTGMEIDLLDPVNSVLEFGTDAATLTGATTNTQRSIQESLGSLDARFTNLTTNVLNAVYANIETIVAGIVTADFIRAAVADLGYVTADWVEANYASIYSLDAIYADIFALQAVTANIGELSADVANIITLLGGEAGFGELETIHLTVNNAIIDEAVIVEALVGTVLADIIQSNVIITDYITIMSEDGGITISGNQVINTNGQWLFYDSDGNVRMQIGQDASGNFSFILYDETGTGIMLDSEGIHASAIPDGLIVDAMVADDANIAASKLDIEDLTRTLNENAELVLSAEQITIGGGTLDYALTEITQQIEDLESMGIESIVNYYAYGTATTYPPFEWEDDDSAVLGEGILGLMVLGVNGDSNWSTEQPPYKEGEYVWWSQKITYVDGTVVWTEPALWTDDYLRNAITIAQTELEVVQGQIQAKVWMSDIETAEDALTATITEQYGILTVLIDTIDQRVGVMETTYGDEFTELYSFVTSLTLDLDGIVAQVTEIDEKTANALLYGVPYYAVSTSPKYYPPFEEGADESAVLGEGILGLMILGETGDFQWSTEQPIAGEGEYVWVAYLVTQLDGSTYWTEPMLLTDDWLRRQMSDMSEKYSQLVLTIDTALLEVYAAISTVEGSVTELDASIREYVDETSADILSEVAGLYVTDSEFTSVTASIEQYVSDEIASIKTSLNYYATTDDLSNAISDATTSINQTITETAEGLESDISLAVQNVTVNFENTLEGYPTYDIMSAAIEAQATSTESSIKIWVGDTYATSDYVDQLLDNLDMDSVQNIQTYYAVSTSADFLTSAGEFVYYTADFTNGEFPDGASGQTYGFSGQTSTYYIFQESDDLGKYLQIGNAHARQGDIYYLLLKLDEFKTGIKSRIVMHIASPVTEASDNLCYGAIKDGSENTTDRRAEIQRGTFAEFNLNDNEWTAIIDDCDFTETDDDYNYYLGFNLEDHNEFLYVKDVSIYEVIDNEDVDWQLVRPTITDGHYLWIRYLITYADGHTEWTDPICVSTDIEISGGELGHKATITLSTNGGIAMRELDLTEVRKAFADDDKAITISAGTILFEANTFMVASENLLVDADGSIEASDATLYGSIVSNYGNYSTGVNNGEFEIYYDDSLMGTIRSYSYSGTDCRGISISCQNADYIGFAIGTFVYYTLNNGLNQYGTERHQFGEDVLIHDGYLKLDNAPLYLRYSYAVRWYDEDNNVFARIYGSSGGNLYIQADAGDIYMNGEKYSSSDKSLKKDISPITINDSKSLIDEIDELVPVEYEWAGENQGGETHYGYIANDVQKVMPELVKEDEDGILYLAYDDIIALLHLKIKQLESRIEQLEQSG